MYFLRPLHRKTPSQVLERGLTKFSKNLYDLLRRAKTASEPNNERAAEEGSGTFAKTANV